MLKSNPQLVRPHQSSIHILLVSLFGIPIVRSISHFFGWQLKKLVDQKKFGIPNRNHLSTVNQKKEFGRPKKIWYTQKKFGRLFPNIQTRLFNKDQKLALAAMK